MPDWVHVLWQTLITITIMFLFAKMLGYRQISQLTFFQYITGITLGGLAATASIERDNVHLALIALTVWALVTFGIEWISMKSKKLRDFFDGKGIVLIKDGKIMEDNLKKVRFTADDLMEQLRKKNAFKAADVEFAVLEPSGDLSVMLRKENQPLTASHLGIQVSSEPEPQTVIMDGELLDEPLATLGLSREWLHTELEKLGVTIENVFLGQVDAYGQLYVDLYDDQIQIPLPQEKERLLATLKKCQADLELFALSTQDEKSKNMYSECASQIGGVLSDVTPWLKR